MAVQEVGVKNILTRITAQSGDNRVGSNALSQLEREANGGSEDSSWRVGDLCTIPTGDDFDNSCFAVKFGERYAGGVALDIEGMPGAAKQVWIGTLRKNVTEYSRSETDWVPGASHNAIDVVDGNPQLSDEEKKGAKEIFNQASSLPTAGAVLQWLKEQGAAGKKLKCVAIKEFKTCGYDRNGNINRLRTTQLPCFNLV